MARFGWIYHPIENGWKILPFKSHILNRRDFHPNAFLLKDEWLLACVIMLCKCWTSMMGANFFWNARVKNFKCYLFLAYLSWKLKWVLITFCPSSVCPSVRLSVGLSIRLSVNFSHFHLLLQNHWTTFNQSWHKASLGKGDSCLFKCSTWHKASLGKRDSCLFKWRAPSSSKGR